MPRKNKLNVLKMISNNNSKKINHIDFVKLNEKRKSKISYENNSKMKEQIISEKDK